MRAKLLSIAALCAVLVPAGVAHATHCDQPIYLFSSVQPAADQDGLPLVTSGAVCTAQPDDTANGDVVYPGANALQVRYLSGGEPEVGTITFAGTTTTLRWHTAYISYVAQPVAASDSQWIPISPADSVAGGDAVIHICDIADDPDSCYTRTYRTVA
jgi:hypothetical protein